MSHVVALHPSSQASRFEAAERLFQQLVGDPARGLAPRDRELFHALLCSLGREVAERARTPHPVRDPAALATWWVEQGRATWSLRIDRRDLHRAKRIIDHLDELARMGAKR